MSVITTANLGNYGNFWHNIGVADDVTYIFYSDTSDWGDTPLGNKLSYKDSSDNYTVKKQIIVPSHGTDVFHHFSVGLAQGDNAFYVFAAYNDGGTFENWCIKFSASGITPQQMPDYIPPGAALNQYCMAHWAYDFSGDGQILIGGQGGYTWKYDACVYDYEINTIYWVPPNIIGLEEYDAIIVPSFRYPFFDRSKDKLYTAFLGIDPANSGEWAYDLKYYLIGFDCLNYQWFAQYVYFPGLDWGDNEGEFNLYKRIRLVGFTHDDADNMYLAFSYYSFEGFNLTPPAPPDHETFFTGHEYTNLVTKCAWFFQDTNSYGDWYRYCTYDRMQWNDKSEGTFIYEGFQQNRNLCVWINHSSDDVWEGDGTLYYTVMRGYGYWGATMGLTAPRFLGYGNFFTVAQQKQDCKIDMTISDYAGRWIDPLGVSTQTYNLREYDFSLQPPPPVPFYLGKNYKNQWFLSDFKIYFGTNKDFSVYSKTINVYDSLTDVLVFTKTILTNDWYYLVELTDGLNWDTEYYFRAFYTDTCGYVGNPSQPRYFTTRSVPKINSVTITDEQFPTITINASMYDSLAKQINVYFKQGGVTKAYSITLDPYNYLDEFTIRFRPLEFDGQLTADTYDYTVEIINEYDRVGSKTGVKVFTFALPAAPLATYALGKGSTTITMNKSCNIYRDNILLVEATDLTYKDIDCILGNAHEYKVVYYDGVAESLPVTLNTTAYEWGNIGYFALCSEDLDMWLKKEVGATHSQSTVVNWIRLYDEIQINEQRDDLTIEIEMEKTDYLTLRETFEDVLYYLKYNFYSVPIKFLSIQGRYNRKKQLYDTYLTGVRL